MNNEEAITILLALVLNQAERQNALKYCTQQIHTIYIARDSLQNKGANAALGRQNMDTFTPVGKLAGRHCRGT